MKTKFYLKRPKEKIPTAIICSVTFSKNRLKIYTGISVEPKYWSKKAHSVRQTPSYRQGSSINARLDKIKGEIEKCYYDYLNNHNAEPTAITFKKHIDKALGRSKETKLSFFEYFQDFINRTKAGQRQTANGKIIKPAKAKSYGTTFNNLTEFNAKLNFENIDLDFYYSWLKHLRDKGYSENNIGTHIKNLKVLLNEATERGVSTNLSYKTKRFSGISEDVDNIALTVEELKDLQDLNLSGTPYLDRVRDIFLIGCYTGLRFSDFSRLTADNIKGNYIEIKQQKTGKPVAIPVHPIIKHIIDKYDESLPNAISNQKFNEYLKKVCKKVPSLCEPTSKTGTKGGLQVTKNYQKWEIITTHTARRSFATNAYLQGIPTITIMAITGHKTEKNFLKYIKVTPKEHAKIMAGIWSRSNMKIAK